jgi:hypothetical protein
LRQVQSILRFGCLFFFVFFVFFVVVALCGCESVNCVRCNRCCGFLLPFGLPCVAVSQSIAAGAIDFAVSLLPCAAASQSIAAGAISFAGLCCLVWLRVSQFRQVQSILRLFVALCGCESVNCSRFGRQLRQVQSILRFYVAFRLAVCGCESVNYGRCNRCCGFVVALCGCESVNCGRCGRRLLLVSQ